MKEIDKKKTPKSNRTKGSERTPKKQLQPNQNNTRKTLNGKETGSRESGIGQNTLVNDSSIGNEPPEIYESVVPEDDELIPEENMNGVLHDHSEQGNEQVSDSGSSQGDNTTKEDDDKVERPLRVHNSLERETSDDTKSRISNKDPSRVSSTKDNSKNMKVVPEPSPESSDGIEGNIVDELKESGVLDGNSNGDQIVGSDDETADAEEKNEHDSEADLKQKIEDMETRIGKLEEELREVAALEISLYSVVPEHGSSAHKVHTPARRLSRLYIHACKYWTQDKRAMIAKNTISGLVLIAKSCGNDVPRLTFWLSNVVVLREIISQAFRSICNTSPMSRFVESNGGRKRNEGNFATLNWKGSSNGKQVNGCVQFLENWQETGTFMAALVKVESWIFSRVVESVWWQALTPNMQSQRDNASSKKSTGRLLGPPPGDQQQGNYSINLWRNAFEDAFQRLCPVRAGGHECGCLPVLPRLVMEQCVARLDVAMFNAILRESAHEIPTDPVSDPIVDSKVLPIPAGDLSFGSGAQLKNSVGSWSRWLTDMFGIDADDSLKDQLCSEDDDEPGGDRKPKSFLLLNALSDLLMLPKDLLMDRTVRKEVCPSISLPLIKRILCNFTPDEFCPDHVPGAVLEALNAESIVERSLSGDSARNFPYTAAPVLYSPPSTSNVAEKVWELGEKSHLERNVSVVQRKGYTSDEELEELNSPLTSIIDKLPPSPALKANGNGGHEEHNYGFVTSNSRYELLREVWSV